MTESFIVFATAAAAFFFIDPVYAGALSKAAPAKLVVLAFGMGSLFFHILGSALNDGRRVQRAIFEVVRSWWPALLLGAFILAGSSYARFANEIKESFLGMGLGISFLPLTAIALRATVQPAILLKSLATVCVLMVAGMLIVLLSGYHVFHEEIFVAVPLGAYLLTDLRPKLWKVLGGLTLMVACVYSFKNTTFILVIFTIFACVMFWVLRLLSHSTGLKRFLGTYVAVVIAVMSLVLLAIVWFQIRQFLPSGSVTYRTEMYWIAWQRFLDSPIWGTGFTESSVTYFSLYKVSVGTNFLPTHSDVLDLLAHGGLIAIALWIATIANVAMMGWRAIRRLITAGSQEDVRGWRCQFTLFLVQLNAILTYSFNPPLINPVHGFWIWSTMGAMWALERYLKEEPVPARPSAGVLHRRFAA